VGRDEGVLREVLGGLDGVGGEGGKGHGVLVGDVGTVGFWEGVKGLVSFFLLVSGDEEREAGLEM